MAVLASLLGFAGWRATRAIRAGRRPLEPGPPNLLLIVTDDQSGFSLGAAGDRRGATPCLDTLARQGVYFARAYCNSPLCTPSRQSFITGLLPHASGVTRLETRLSDSVLTLGSWLGSQGYRTAAIGKMHFNGPSRHGFDTRIDVPQWLLHLRQHPPEGGDLRKEWRPFVDPPRVWLNTKCEDEGLPAASTASAYFVDCALETMKRADERPFAVVVGFYDPHAPFRFPREWRGRYRREQFSVAPVSVQDLEDQPRVFRELSADDIRGIQAAYSSSLSFVDAQIGRLLRGLDDSGLTRNTLVVFLSDNGYLLGQHGRVEKNCFYEPAVRVPLIVRWPGHLPAGKSDYNLVELIDLFPTVCHLLGVPRPPHLQGEDLVPLLEGKLGARGRDIVFSEYPENEEAMVRSDRYKLIVGSGRRQRKDHLETGHPPSSPYQRLFDLERDPDETTDISGDLAVAAIRDALLEKMYQRLVATWTGPDPIPPNMPHLEVICWCLIPRDDPAPASGRPKDGRRRGGSGE
jgi:choline-sulfatase